MATYYYGGKFNPWTKGHMSVLEGLLGHIQANYDEIVKEVGPPRIVIGVKSGEMEGTERIGAFDSVMYRKGMIREAIEGIQRKYPFLKDFNEYTSNDKIDVVEQTLDRTWDEFTSKPFWWPRGDDNPKVVLVMGDDEHADLVDSAAGKSDKWMHAQEILASWDVLWFNRDPFVSSTRVREIFRADPFAQYTAVSDYIQKPVYEYIVDNMLYWQEDEAEARKAENLFLAGYDMAKFPRPSCTATVVAMFGDKVLLVRRKGHPYKGYWALPGGFFDVQGDESLVCTAMRELAEETGLRCPEGAFHLLDVFSRKGVDPRGRIVDTVYYLVCGENSGAGLKASDDAEELRLWPVDALPRMAFHHREVVGRVVAELEVKEMKENGEL